MVCSDFNTSFREDIKLISSVSFSIDKTVLGSSSQFHLLGQGFHILLAENSKKGDAFQDFECRCLHKFRFNIKRMFVRHKTQFHVAPPMLTQIKNLILWSNVAILKTPRWARNLRSFHIRLQYC